MPLRDAIFQTANALEHHPQFVMHDDGFIVVAIATKSRINLRDSQFQMPDLNGQDSIQVLMLLRLLHQVRN
jgi:pterin-4a-carbinolamine dehydratase